MNYLREWTIDDAPALSKIINEKITQNLRDGIPFPYTAHDSQEFIRQMLSAEEGTQYAWAIDYDGYAVGSLGIFRQKNIHYRTAELGYFIAEEYWGQGITTSAVKQACQFVFETTDILRIYAEPFSHNIASCRVLEKAGFEYEGLLRKNAIKNGCIYDMKMYALIKD